MDKLALAFSFVAICAAGWLGWTATDLAREGKAQEEARSALESRLATLERAAAAAEKAVTAAPAPAAPVATDARGGPAPSAVLGGSARPSTRADVETRLAKLEKAVKDALSGGARVPAQVAPDPQTIEVNGPAGDERWYGSVDDAQKHLDLTTGQRAEFERAVAEAKKEIDDLHKVPDADGKTWDQVQKDGVSFNGGMINYDGSKLQAFREKTIPGRAESFGAAERRIGDDAKKRLRGALTAEQQTKFDKAHSEGMLGTGSGGDIFSFISIGGINPPPLPGGIEDTEVVHEAPKAK